MKKKILMGLLCLCLAGTATGCKQEVEGKENSGLPAISTDVELGNYMGVEVTMLSTEVTEEEVQKGLESFVTGTMLPRTDRTDVQNGDIANINYTGKVDGTAFEGGTDDTEAGTDLEIGSGSFIPGFEEQLIGHTVGETFDINVTFPEDYGEEGTTKAELNGQEAVFTVTVNALKRYATMDDLTDQFVAEYDKEYKTIDEWKTGYTAKLKTQKEQLAENQFQQDAIQAVIDGSKFKEDLAESISSVENNMKAYYQSVAAQYGIEFEMFLAIFMGMTQDQFNTEVAKAAEFSVKQRIIANKIVEVEKMKLTDEEYTTGLAEMANEAQAESPEVFETENGKEVIQETLLLDKACQLIIDNAVKKQAE